MWALSSQGAVEDTRTLGQYLEDVQATERKGLYPSYTGYRKRILDYWESAIESGKVNPDDPINMAVRKMKGAT